MRQKVIFVLVDGLTLASAITGMSFLNALIMEGKGARGQYKAFLPPLSRPAYATLLTGQPPLEHGVVSNDYWETPIKDNLFYVASKTGHKTAAAAYKWFFELCWDRGFDLRKDRFVNDSACPIQYGLFYSDDFYPDNELFADAEALRKNFDPDLLLAHCMGVDWAGHCEGSESSHYLNAVRKVDGLLAAYLPAWLSAGYKILITSDHGMDKYGSHYDDNEQCRAVPIYLFGEWPEKTPPVSPCGIRRLVMTGLGL